MRSLTLLLALIVAALGGAAPVTAVEQRTIRIAVVPFNFSNDTRSPGDLRRIGNHLFNIPDTDGVNRSTAAFYADASYGRLTVTGTIFPTVTIPDTNAGCEENGGENGFYWWASLAREQLEATGASLSSYDKVAYLWPRLAACGFGGKAPVGGRELYLNLPPTLWSSSTSWVYNWYVVTHELGHSLGARHAGAAFCTNSAGTKVALSGSCRETFPSTDSYDPFDMMLTYYKGWSPSWSKRLPSVHHRFLMGFVDPSEIATLSAPGTYTISLNPAEFAASATKEIVIVRPLKTAGASTSSVAGGRQLCLEWHRPKGWFNNWSTTSSLVAGLLVRICDPATGSNARSTRLVDTRPGSYSGATDWKDAALTVGRSLTDAFSGVKITVLSRTLSTTPAKSVLRVRVIIPDNTPAASPTPSPTPVPAP